MWSWFLVVTDSRHFRKGPANGQSKNASLPPATLYSSLCFICVTLTSTWTRALHPEPRMSPATHQVPGEHLLNERTRLGSRARTAQLTSCPCGFGFRAPCTELRVYCSVLRIRFFSFAGSGWTSWDLGGWRSLRVSWASFFVEGHIYFVQFKHLLSACLVAVCCAVLCLVTRRYRSPPGSSVHGILQARMLDWVTMPSSRLCIKLTVK